MKTKTIYSLMFCIAMAFCLYVTPSAIAASAEDEVLQVAVNWDKAMNNGDFELMSSLYLHSPKTSEFAPNKGGAFLIYGWDALESIIKNTMGLPKGTFSGATHNVQVTMLGDNVALLTYYQNMTVNPPAENEQKTLLVRATRILQKVDGKWLIVHDHGSVFPTE